MATSKTASPAPAKKAAAKKSATKKRTTKPATKQAAPAKKETSMPKLGVGDDVFTSVDPRQNGGSSVAAAKVTGVNEDGVNLTVFLDSEENQWVRNVEVVKSEPKADDEVSGRVCWAK